MFAYNSISKSSVHNLVEDLIHQLNCNRDMTIEQVIEYLEDGRCFQGFQYPPRHELFSISTEFCNWAIDTCRVSISPTDYYFETFRYGSLKGKIREFLHASDYSFHLEDGDDFFKEVEKIQDKLLADVEVEINRLEQDVINKGKSEVVKNRKRYFWTMMGGGRRELK